MRKFKFFINYDKEEKWLNEMAKNGYELESVFCGYQFRFSKPQNTIIRIDYRTFKSKEDFIDYCTLFEDSGWKHIVGSRYAGAQYFKKINENEENDIFSDAVSKAGKYKRLSDLWMMLAISYLPILSALISSKNVDIKAILNPKLLYYTPGLWEMAGMKFWTHFLFETPFAAFRGVSWLIILVMAVLYFVFSIKANILYNKTKKTV